MNPNILILVLDCARADHFSCYGYERPTTPFIDGLAARGTRFTNMVSSAPWTLPSHASLFTGMYSAFHGATDESRKLAPGATTIAELLSGHGYQTAAFCANPWVSPETGFDRGIDHFFTNRPRHPGARYRQILQKAWDVAMRRRDSGSFHTNRAAGRWLGSLDSGRPFFAFVHYNETHLKFHPPARYRRMFTAATDSRIRRLNQDCNAYIAGTAAMTDDDFQLLTALYDGELRFADSRFEQLAALIEGVGRLENTIFVVLADHGENLGDHGMMSHKFSLYETLLRVPLVMAGPGVPAGQVSEGLVQNVDVFSTLASLVGLPESDYSNVHGRAAIVAGHLQDGRDYVFSERYRPNLSVFKKRYPDFDTSLIDVRKRSVCDGREKLIWHSDGRHEFYDLVDDPAEARNLAAQRSQDVSRLEGVLSRWIEDVKGQPGGGENPSFDDVARRQLEGLGYID